MVFVGGKVCLASWQTFPPTNISAPPTSSNMCVPLEHAPDTSTGSGSAGIITAHRTARAAAYRLVREIASVLLRQFPVPPMPGFRHQQPSWGLGPSQSQHNHTIGFREAETLYHHLIHASSGTFCDFPFYNQPFYQRLFAKDRKQPTWASRTYVGRSRNIRIRRDYVHIPSPNRLISLTVLYEPFF